MWPPTMWWSISSIWVPTKKSAFTWSRLNVSSTWFSVRTGGGMATDASCRTAELSQILAEPLQHPPPGIVGGGSVVAGSDVVEERMVGIRFDDDVVDQPGEIKGCFGRRLGSRDTGVEGSVEPQHSGRQFLRAGGQQLPYQPAAEAKPHHRDFPARYPHLQFVDPGIQIRDEAARLNGAQCGGGLRRIREVAGAAFLGQQVDGQCRVAGPREPSGHRPHPIVEALVLVDDQHPATGIVGLRPDALEFSIRSGPGGRLGR